jgi:hypothetical protein
MALQAIPARSLGDFVLSVQWDDAAIVQHRRLVQDYLLAQSRHVRQADFEEIHKEDLQLLFAAYDCFFLEGLGREALGGRRLSFRLAPRMTRAGGKTARMVARDGTVSYEISIAVMMLFDSFRPGARQVTVCGMECGSLLDALGRIFEHELVHLIENMCWAHTDCAAPRFQEIARRLFGHVSHTHNLITQRERAAESGIRVGSQVRFQFEGRELEGRVNRITKRATVLVEDPAGMLYSDGLRYKGYYVPLGHLQRLEES